MADPIIITPAAGNAPFPTQGGVGESPGFDAIDYRRFWSHSYVEGVTTAAAWRVTEGALATDMNISVAADLAAALVQGDAVVDQGLYYVAPHADAPSITLDPADPTNPRVDRIVLRVYDDAHDGSGENKAQIEPLAGTPTAGASKENGAGAVPVPDGSLWLADVEVGAGVSAITNDDILDYRPFALKDARVGDLRFSYSGTPGDGWEAADFAELNRAQHFRLFAEIGTSAGAGNGSSTFNKPDLRGRVPMGAGSGPGLATRTVGQKLGEDNHSLTAAENGPHAHAASGSIPTYQDNTAQSALTVGMGDLNASGASAAVNVSIQSSGSGAAHNNVQPSTVGNWYVFTGSVAVG